jgi:hypothetical protein
MKKPLLLLGTIIVITVVIVFLRREDPVPDTEVVATPQATSAEETPAPEAVDFTERYTARVDRVDVVFEHKDYTWYRLTTNGLVREGELNTERGFEDDVDATVYVLNWQKPEGEQLFYVRLTAEPGRLYALDGERKLLRGSALILEP